MGNTSDMESEGQCRRCGGAQILMRPWAQNFRPVRRSMPVELATQGETPSLVNGHIAAVALIARVCTVCGYAEFFAENPAALPQPE